MMRKNSPFAAHRLALILLTAPLLLYGQFNGSLRSEYQGGNLPDEEPSNRVTLYNQLNLRYNSGALAFGLRAENYYVDAPGEYTRITQAYLRYSSGDWRLQAGHFYEILGRGLLLRSYEIPGTTYEDGASRQRYGFYKDIEGLSLRYTNDRLSVKALFGRPLDFSLPPERSRRQRRSALVHGGEINLRLADVATPGVLWLRSDANGVVTEYGGLNLDGYWRNSQYYIEYVQNTSGDPFALGKNSSHAFYLAASQSLGPAGLTLEYKDYNDFTLVFNDPPPLVREHSYTLLNRITHPVEPSNESGYQAELLFNIGGFNTVTLNHARAENDFGGTLFVYQASYGDINYYIKDDFLVKAFADLSRDDLDSARDRYTTGIAAEKSIGGPWSLNGDLQYQSFKRRYMFNPALNHAAHNQLISLGVNRAPDLSLAFVLERTDDPVENNRLTQQDKNRFSDWPALYMTWQYQQGGSLALFYGKRRGGNACTGGICYQVLPFEGIELRLTHNF